MSRPEIYVSTDVESDGPIPGPFSMLSFGSAAYLADKTLVGTFSANLETLPGAEQDPTTMEFWAQNQLAWDACRTDCLPPEQAMRNYADWLEALPGKPVFVGYPVAYDFMFVYWYLIRFAGRSPFSHSALDIKTLAMAVLGGDYREASKRNMPQRWFDPIPFSHSALDIKTLAMAVLGGDYREASKRNMPQRWFDPIPHTHVALDDALGQGALFCNILAELRPR